MPKILIDVAGEPLLARQLRYLGTQGVLRVVVNAHHFAEQVEDFAAEHSRSPALVVVVEEHLLGTAGGVRNALAELGDDPFFVLYGDVLVDEPLAPVMDAHRAGGVVATITVYESTRTKDKGTVEVDDAGRVASFREKQAVPPERALINAGIYVVEPSFLRGAVAPGAVSDFGHDVFPAALAAGKPLGVYRLDRPVLDVGTPADLEAARGRDVG